MGKRETHICDVCKCDLPIGSMGFPAFRVGDVTIKLSKQGWGDYEFLASWKGELCDDCVKIVEDAALQFNVSLNTRFRAAAPGEHIRPEAEASIKKPTMARQRIPKIPIELRTKRRARRG